MEAVASQFLRAVRGKRSQVAFARRLGYRANPITDWETGRRFPTAVEALRACERAGIAVDEAFTGFHPAAAPNRAAPDGLARWLDTLRGSLPIGELARRADASRFSVGRWLSGRAHPRLPEFFRLVDAITGRLPDLVAELVAIESVPALLARHHAAAAAKRLAFEAPWTEAVLRVIETTDYRERSEHTPGWIAERLGIEIEEEQRCVEALLAADLLRREGSRYVVSGALTVDTRADPAATRRLFAHWSEVAVSRVGRGRGADMLAYNVLSVSEADLVRIRELLRSTYREIRAIVAASEPSETAALLNVHLVSWPGEEARSPERRPP